jgi:hypothetical protein
LTVGDVAFDGTVGGNMEPSSDVQAVVDWFGRSDLLVAGSRSAQAAR